MPEFLPNSIGSGLKLLVHWQLAKLCVVCENIFSLLPKNSKRWLEFLFTHITHTSGAFFITQLNQGGSHTETKTPRNNGHAD